ncbi:MAG TPA: methylenetetrahydrofolate reductase [Euryarchaeota archaeon]|nr:methylenetetrahydrofolate reductase [Euryarchaeota archaeon]
MSEQSNLEKILSSGKFAVTAEIGPPRGADPTEMIELARKIKGSADAFNLTDNQTAIVRLSSIGSAVLLMKEGIEPVIQMTCRDRNRIALQSDLLGASAIGVKNVLCLTGDHHTFGNEKSAKGVFDLDSISLLNTFKNMRDTKKQLSGEELDSAPNIYLGAAENPFATPYEYRAIRMAKKVKAGAQFIQTQAIFDLDWFERWMAEVRKMDLHEKVHILGGVIPVKSAGALRYMKNKVPGMIVPDALIGRMNRAEDKKEEGIQICIEMIERLKQIEGVHGVHIMAVMWEQIVPRLVTDSKLMPRTSV